MGFYTAHASAPLLFGASTIANANALSKLGKEDSVVRSRFASVQIGLLSSMIQNRADHPSDPMALTLNLFSDTVLNMDILKIEHPISGSTVLTGTITGTLAGESILVFRDGLVAASIFDGMRFYQVRPAPAGDHIIQETDRLQFPNELPGVPATLSGDAPGPVVWEMDTDPVIDILVVYTEAARSGTGGTTAIETLIDLAVAETNTGYANSSITQRLRLVHTEEVVYSETGFNWSDTLSRLRGTSDGYMDNVHTLRDTYGADEVVLIVNNAGSCGIGYVMQYVSAGFESYAFAVVSRTCATGYYSFAHELGHNMGCAHDRANASISGAYDYAYGYQAPDEAFRTIMAYNCPGGCTRVNYWSNAGNSYGGQAMGVIYTAPAAAENFRALNNTAQTVASFRDQVFPGIEVSPESWNAGSVLIGESADRTFTVTNTGTGDLEVTDIALTGNTDFSISFRG